MAKPTALALIALTLVSAASHPPIEHGRHVGMAVDDRDLTYETAWHLGLAAASHGGPSVMNPHKADAELADYWSEGWTKGQRLRWLHHMRSRRAHL